MALSDGISSSSPTPVMNHPSIFQVGRYSWPDNIAYLRYNQTLYACDATTGKTLWSQSAGSPPTDSGEILPAPTVAGGSVFAVLGDGKLHAFSAITGAPLWPAPFAADLPIRTQPVVANGLVIRRRGWRLVLRARCCNRRCSLENEPAGKYDRAS